MASIVKEERLKEKRQDSRYGTEHLRDTYRKQKVVQREEKEALAVAKRLAKGSPVLQKSKLAFVLIHDGACPIGLGPQSLAC